MENIYGDFWAAFLEETGRPATTVLQNYTYFGHSEAESVAVLEQLLSGEKTAVSHCIPAYLTRRARMPRQGDYTMVTDFYGNPCCIYYTEDVTILPMPEMPEALTRRDTPALDPAAWGSLRREEYQALAKATGFHYHDQIPVLMEHIRLVYPA